MSDDVVKTWVNFLEEELRGPRLNTDEVHPISRNKIERDAIYSPAEKKTLRPKADCIAMYAKNNSDAAKVVKILGDFRGRILEPCQVTADSLYDAFLFQVSHKKDKYNSYFARRQFTYFLIKYPEVFLPVVEPHLKEGESFESFALNMFHGYSFPVFDVVAAVATKMWNLAITLVTPKGVRRAFHNRSHKDCDIVIVWNCLTGVDSQFTATKVDNLGWKPVRPLDWTAPVKNLINVKAAAEQAEKMFRRRSAKKIQQEFTEVSEAILSMKEQLVNMHSEVEVLENHVTLMKENITKCANNMQKMEGSQDVLRQKLTDLGVDITKFAQPGSVVPGYHNIVMKYTAATPSETPAQGSSSAGATDTPVGGNATALKNPYILLNALPLQRDSTVMVTSADVHAESNLTPALAIEGELVPPQAVESMVVDNPVVDNQDNPRY